MAAVAVHVRSAPMSRIPKLKPVLPPANALHADYVRTNSAPTRLEEIQADYQRKMLMERQKKMSTYSLQEAKPGNKGLVRDFFKERRTLEYRVPDAIPDITHHYAMKKAQFRSPHSFQNTQREPLLYRRNSAGRDRSHPLQPLQNKPPAGPSPANRQGSGKQRVTPSYIPTPPVEKKPRLVQPIKRYHKTSPPSNNGPDSGYDSPPHDQNSTLNNNKPQRGLMPIRKPPPNRQPNAFHGPTPASTKMTDFQKWQQEQNKARQERLEKHRREQEPESQPSDSSLGSIQNSSVGGSNTQKLTGFQKWKEEQSKRKAAAQPVGVSLTPASQSEYVSEDEKDSVSDLNKEKTHRLVKQKQKILKKQNFKNKDNEQFEETPPTSQRSQISQRSERVADPEAEIEQKEAELLALIQKQQVELEDMKRRRAQEDEQERQERERREQAMRQQEERRLSVEQAEAARRAKQQPERDEQRDPPLSHRSQKSCTPTFEVVMQAPHLAPRGRKKAAPPAETKPVSPLTPPPPKPRPQPKQQQQQPQQPVADIYNQSLPDEFEEAPLDLRPCPICGRKFAADRLDRHKNTCVEGKKKRKVMDSVKLRTRGTEAEKYVQHAARAKAPKREKTAEKKSSWRSKHQNFIDTIRYAKKMSQIEAAGGNLADLPPPPPSENPDYIQCPHCQRKFNTAAAERHIPKCQSIKAKPAPPPARRRR